MTDNPTMQDVLRKFYPKYLEMHTPNEHQAKAVRHILNCKTGAYGANISKCEKCGHAQYHNNSCRDRSCPMCQALSNEMWVDAQNEYVLDIDYYHLVFTCPSELNPLIYCNQKELYSLFFHAAAETILELSKDPAHMGGTPGFISIMHTWGSNLSYHPTFMRYQPVAGWMQSGTGIRKKMDSSCLGRRWPCFLKGNSCPV